MWKQQIVILIGLLVLFLPLLVRTRAVQKWWLIGMGVLAFAAIVAQLFGFPPVHRDRTTFLLELIGMICLAIGLRWSNAKGGAGCKTKLWRGSIKRPSSPAGHRSRSLPNGSTH